MNEGMILVRSPGLPPWPALWFNAEKKQAIVSARIATWRSYEWAIRTIRWSVILFGVWFSLRLWQRLPDLDGKWFPWSVGSLAIAFFLSILHPWLDMAFRNFLARQAFARKATIWLTPHAIAFRSSLYAREQIVPRLWQRLPVVLRFDLAKDHYAQHAMANLKPEKRHDCTHLKMAQVLRLIIRVANTGYTATLQNQTNVMRSVLLTEVLSIDAERMTTVLTAAASLTTTNRHEASRTISTGFDIDDFRFDGSG